MEKRNNGQELVVTINNNDKALEITESMVKNYICQQATRGDIFMFLQLCQAQNLNPFIGEAYLIKYGSDVQMVVGKETFMKRAESNPEFQDLEAGIIVGKGSDKDFSFEFRNGAFYFPHNEKLLGGWAKVQRKDREKPITIEIPIQEYLKRNRDGKVNKQWATMPATMIRKVALVQALREAFPNALGGCYIREEVAEGEREIIDAHYTPSNGSNIETSAGNGNGNGTSTASADNSHNNANDASSASAYADTTANSDNKDSEETISLTEEESLTMLTKLKKAANNLKGEGLDKVQEWWFDNKNEIDRLINNHRDELVTEVKEIKKAEMNIKQDAA